MQISHEVPISYLGKSKTFNDYDYCLLHLIDIPEYRNFYINSIKEGRKVLLDNSMYELGDALTIDAVREGVKIINPTWVVVPDCFNDMQTTIDRFSEWLFLCSDLNVKTIGVVHGKDLTEMIRCYKFMSTYADKIAIPFGSCSYDIIYPSEDRLESHCMGRIKFIQHLVDNKIWNYEKPHHLLGCNYAKEFGASIYRELNIESLDTSNPVVAAMENIKFKKDGLDMKPTIKLCDLINHEIDKDTEKLMLHNIKTFRKICDKDLTL